MGKVARVITKIIIITFTMINYPLFLDFLEKISKKTVIIMAETAAIIKPDWCGKFTKISDSPAATATHNIELSVLIWGTMIAINAGTKKKPKFEGKYSFK